jgi:muramoyltetrapeptide carboxypeptidase
MPKIISLNKPKKLKKGDRIGIIAPAGAVNSDDLEIGLKVIKGMGFDPVLSQNIGNKKRTMAGNDSERAFDLMTMFADSDIKGIFCARGGYGSNRILPLLTSKVIRDNPKVFVGSSDTTALHIFLNQKCALHTFHGPMVAGSFGRAEMKKSKKLFADILMGKASAKQMTARQIHVIRPGSAKGELAGGCLTLLCRSLRTPHEIKTENKILLIEDVNEPFYKLDGMLWQLKQAGKLKNLKGVILGEMIGCRPANETDGPLEHIIEEVFAEYSYPVMMNAPIGHGEEMWTLPLGIKATMDCNTRSLTLDSCGVA